MSMAEALGMSREEFDDMVSADKSEIPFNNCDGCKYWDDFSWSCGNGRSERRGDFVNFGCSHKEDCEDWK